jgi:S-adenosylmethionine synthetase
VLVLAGNSSNKLFTSESVTKGHPDKVADQISDAVLDSLLAVDPYARVACETLVTTGLVVVAGEATAHNPRAEKALLSVEDTVRRVIRQIGYDDPATGFDYRSCAVLRSLHSQSADISRGVDGVGSRKRDKKAQGAGDQGLMFGFACDETKALMPLPIQLAHRLTARLTEARESGQLPWLRPDGKSQVTVEYHGEEPARLHTVVLSTQHDESALDHKAGTISKKARKQLINEVIKPVVCEECPRLWNSKVVFHINPTGRFVIGGPCGDTGLTGRKIIVDTYGGRGSHGGGAFSGKDPSKVDRSASYMARHIAKNVVAARLARACEVQLSYAIGVAEPISVLVDCEGTAVVDESVLARAIHQVFPLTPACIIDDLKLLRPIYQETAHDGHFGRTGRNFTWEKTGRVRPLRKACGL